MKTFAVNVYSLIAVLITTSLFSCTNTTNDGKMYSSSIAGNTKKTALNEEDLRFLVKAYSTGLYKIAIANEAAVRSTSAESSQLAKAINTFQLDVNSKMEEIAHEHGLTLPMDLTNDQKLEWKQLVKQKGWSFDEKFCSMVEKLNLEETQLYEQAKKNSEKKSVAILVEKALPELRLHQYLKQVLHEKVNENTIAVIEDEEKKDKPKTKSKKVAS